MRHPALLVLASTTALGSCTDAPEAPPAEPHDSPPAAAVFASGGGAEPAIVLDHGGVADTVSSQITSYAFSVATGDTNVLETKNCSDGADPVMHLFVNGAEVSRNDNGGGGVNARITYTAPNGSTPTLMIRAKDNGWQGECDLYRNGAFKMHAVVGGVYVTMPALRAGEAVETVHGAGAAAGNHTAYLFAGDTQGFAGKQVGGGTAGGLRLLGPGEVRFLLVTGSGGQPVRVIRNDAAVAGHDDDGDTLGDELEQALGTCGAATPAQGGYECADAVTSRDTDADGIRDGWEVLGRRDLTPHQPLPRWGANPRHKDLFLEVDFMERCPDADPAGDARLMSVATAREMAAIFGDTARPLTVVESVRRALQLRNPDALPGIALHLDIGRAAATPADATLYGDWGGHSDVPPIATDEPQHPCGFKGQEAAVAWPTHMALARRGIFHYALTYPGGGGATRPRRLYSEWGYALPEYAAHEIGHALGLHHASPVGAYNPTVAPTCVPQYDSIMSYAYLEKYNASKRTFSDGIHNLVVDNLAATERFAVNTADTRLLADLDSIFGYRVDTATGHVDWNRNGVYDEGTVRAYTNFAANSLGCEWANKFVQVHDESATAVAMAHAYGSLHVAFAAGDPDDTSVNARPVKLRTTWGPGVCYEATPGCVPAQFTQVLDVGLDGRYGVAMGRIQAGTSTSLLVVAVDHLGRVAARRVEKVAGQWELSPVEYLTIAGYTTGMPGIFTDGDRATVAVRRNLDNRVYLIEYDGGWPSPPSAAREPDGDLLTPMSADTSPNLVWGYLPFSGIAVGTPSLFGLFPGSDGRLRIFRRDDDRRWTIVPMAPVGGSAPGPIKGRPSGAWVTESTLGPAGRVYIAYNSTGNQPRMAFTYRVPEFDGTREYLGLDAPFINNTLHAPSSPTLLFDPAYDQTLRAVLPLPFNDAGENGLLFYPNADGMTHTQFHDWSDWATMSTSLCRTLMRPQDARCAPVDPAIPSPVECPDWTYTIHEPACDWP